MRHPMTFALMVGSVLLVGRQAVAENPKVFEAHGKGTCMAPGLTHGVADPSQACSMEDVLSGFTLRPCVELERCWVTGAGVLNSTMVTTEAPDGSLQPGGFFVFQHTDIFWSETQVHRDPGSGELRPDTFVLRHTGVFLPPSATNPLGRFTFLGGLSEGTGMFAGISGHLAGFGTVASPPVAPCATGSACYTYTLGGEVHLGGTE